MKNKTTILILVLMVSLLAQSEDAVQLKGSAFLDGLQNISISYHPVNYSGQDYVLVRNEKYQINSVHAGETIEAQLSDNTKSISIFREEKFHEFIRDFESAKPYLEPIKNKSEFKCDLAAHNAFIIIWDNKSGENLINCAKLN